MAEPVDAILAFHNAFRNDMKGIDAAALDLARGKQGVTASVERYRFFNEILGWHAQGEEEAVFPAIDGVAPLVAEAYLRDHRGLDAAFEALDSSYAAGDPLRTARATAAFRFHLDMHLDKEDAHLYRIFRERIPKAEQGRAMRIMAGKIPQDRFPEVVGWLFPLIGHDDRENMVRIWQMVLPPPAFAGAKELARKSIGKDWAELQRRIPGL
jgi:hemerythrin-like domain-containing protein